MGKTYCKDTVNILMEKFLNSGRSVQEEIEEVQGAISNERLWLLGSDTRDEILGHTQNIIDDEAYLARLEAMMC